MTIALILIGICVAFFVLREADASVERKHTSDSSYSYRHKGPYDYIIVNVSPLGDFAVNGGMVQLNKNMIERKAKMESLGYEMSSRVYYHYDTYGFRGEYPYATFQMRKLRNTDDSLTR